MGSRKGLAWSVEIGDQVDYKLHGQLYQFDLGRCHIVLGQGQSIWVDIVLGNSFKWPFFLDVLKGIA